ncbi:MAG: hypothetical protein ABFS02_06315 [Pseudomonadota bacterium]
MSTDKSTRIDKVKEALIEEISIKSAGNPDTGLLDRVKIENAESNIKARKKNTNDSHRYQRFAQIFRDLQIEDLSACQTHRHQPTGCGRDHGKGHAYQG